MTEKQPPAKVEGIRLPPHLWPKFRAVLKANGRAWLEKLIAREHKKLETTAMRLAQRTPDSSPDTGGAA